MRSATATASRGGGRSASASSSASCSDPPSGPRAALGPGMATTRPTLPASFAPNRRALSPQRATPRARGTVPPVDPELAAVRKLAFWLDRVPLDGLIGLVLPGVGDVVG